MFFYFGCMFPHAGCFTGDFLWFPIRLYRRLSLAIPMRVN